MAEEKIGLNTENSFLIWKLQDTLTIQEAVLLMVGVVPEGKNTRLLSNQHEGAWPLGVLPVVRLIVQAIKSEKVKGRIVAHQNYDEDEDISLSTVDALSLTQYLRAKKVKDHFFNNEDAPKAEYLDPTNPNYAPKLAAAIKAWEAVTLSPDFVGQAGTPKQKLEKWLRLHAAQFGLLREDGKFNEEGIKEIAKVANWQPQGGASQTPSSTPLAPVPSAEEGIFHVPLVTLPTPQKPKQIAKDVPWDDEIPF